MRIAIFHELPVMSGSRKSVDAMATGLSKNHKIDVYYTADKPTHKKNVISGKYFFYNFTPVNWRGNDPWTRLNRDTLELFKLYLLHRKIAKKIKKKKYDAVFIHGSFLTESPLILQFQIPNKIYYAHAPNYTLVFEKVVGIPKIDRARYLYEIVNRFIRKMIDKSNVRKADLVLANSIYTKNKISQFYKVKSTVCYLGVDTKIYRPMGTVKKYDFVFVGSMNPVDGYNLLHQSIPHLKKSIKYKILAIENEWIGTDKEMAKLYNNAKVVLCLAHSEPFGLSAIEALACGVPVIAVEEAGYKETIISGKNGYLINRNSEALLKAINRILIKGSKYKKMSIEARKSATENWSLKESIKKLDKIITKKIQNEI